MSESKGNRYRFVIAAVMLPSRFGTGVTMAAASALLPLIMRDFAISRGTVSWFFSASQMMTTAFAVPAGILARRIGLKKTLAVGFFLQAAGILTPLFLSFPLLLLTRALFGIGLAMTNPVAPGIMAQWFNRRELPLANATTHVSTTVGQTISLLITIPIVGVLSWRGALASYGATSLFSAFLWLILGREKPVTVRGSPEPPASKSKPETEVPPTVWQVLRRREALLLGGSLMGAFCLYTSLTAWLPTYYYEVFKMPLAKASSVSAIFRMTGIPGVILGGILPMRLGLRKPLVVISGLMVGVTGFLSFIVNNPVIIFPALAIYGVFGVIYMPSVYTIPMELPGMTPQTGSLALALALAAGGLGGFMGPIIVGYLTDLTGSYLPGLLTTCVLSLSLFFGSLLLPETGPRLRRDLKPTPVKELA